MRSVDSSRRQPARPGVLGAVLLLAVAGSPQDVDPHRAERERMVASQIGPDVAGRTPVTDPRVLDALRSVPRHRFVPDDVVRYAYADQPLPIGFGQTISQPYIVAAMTELLKVDRADRVLEVGTGSGYQAAVLAELVQEVFTIEIVEPLEKAADERLRSLGYANVQVRFADGYFGWEEHAPFDAVIVTAASSHIPPPLVAQLKPGGRMVIPVGPPLQVQSLMLVEKRLDGSVTQRNLMAVRFVPLTRGE